MAAMIAARLTKFVLTIIHAHNPPFSCGLTVKLYYTGLRARNHYWHLYVTASQRSTPYYQMPLGTTAQLLRILQTYSQGAPPMNH